MDALIWETAEELDQKLAGRIRNIRKRRSISQQKLANMSGVSYGSIKRFETTGQISLVLSQGLPWRLELQMSFGTFFHRFHTGILRR